MSYTRHMTQTVTYWAAPTNDGLGNLTFPSPSTLTGRWQQKAEVFRDAAGNETVSHAVVYLPSAVELQGWLVLGDETGESDPQTVSGAHEIRSVGFSDDLRGDKRLHKVWL